MESEVAVNRPAIHPLTLWSINPRLQTRFDLEDGGGGGGDVGDTPTDDASVVTDDTPSGDTGVGDSQPTTTTDDTPSGDVDPEEAERLAWQKDFEAAPPRVQQAMIRYAERMKALEQEVESRRQPQQPPQPQVDPKTQDQQLHRFLVDNERVHMEAQMRAINAQAAGNEAEYEKQLSIMAQAKLNIGAITKEQARYEVMAELNARSRPAAIEEEFRAHKPFEPVVEAAPGFAKIEHLLTQGVRLTPQQARDLVTWTANAAAQGKTKPQPKPQSTKVTEIEQARARARSRSETPDGGVSGGKQAADPYDKLLTDKSYKEALGKMLRG